MVLGFGNKGGRPKKVLDQVEDEDEEENDDEEDEPKEVESPKPIKKLVKDVEVKPMARLIAGKVLGDGIYEYTLVTNKSLGEIGSEFEI